MVDGHVPRTPCSSRSRCSTEHGPVRGGYTDSNRRVFRLKSIRVIDTPERRLAFPVVEDGNIRELTRFPLDIVHVHTPFTVGLLGKCIATHQHVPIIYTHHTHYPEYAKAYLKERVVLPFLAKLLSAWFSNISDAVIAPSPKIRALLRAYGVQKPIYVLPTGIRLQQFRRTRGRVPEEHAPCACDSGLPAAPRCWCSSEDSAEKHWRLE